jgi:uncharacterized lipoprotein YddW (UPF0748 family)
VHGGGDATAEEWRRRFARIRAAGIGGVLVGGGDTTMLAEAAHAEGLAFHRWTWILNLNGDKWAQEHRPEWFTVSREGKSSLENPPYVGYYRWVCPTREPVREYLRQVVRDIARKPGVDGVHLDYIRHCDVVLPVGLWSKYGLVQDREHPEFDFCYCDVCRESFQRQTGRDPLELDDPTADVKWREFRARNVTDLVRGLATAIRAERKQVTAAVFATPWLARKLVRQAWDEWPLDAMFPMLYHEAYAEDVPWIGRSVRKGRAALPAATPLYAGLYIPSLPPDELARAVRVARDAGAAGVSLFEMNGLTDEHLKRLAEAVG